MILRRNCFLLLSLIILSVSCQKDKNVEPVQPINNKPDLETLDADVSPEGGVTLNGRINKLMPGVKRLGFVLSTDSLFRASLITRLLDKWPSTGAVSDDVYANLNKNQRYYYALFQVDSATRYIQADSKSFIPNGPRKIKVISISPLTADIGDTLTVTGKYFTGQYMSAKFGTQGSSVIPVSDSVFKITVPSNINDPKPLLTVEYSGRKDTISDKFSLYAPIISNFTTTGTFRDIITINGMHFNSDIAGNEVKFGELRAEVKMASRKRLEVIVPDELKHSVNQVSVKAQMQTVIAAENFKIKAPEITMATLSGKVGDPVTIEGKYFHPLGYKNTVIFETTPAERVTGNNNKLTTVVPNGAYPNRKAVIKVKVLDDIATYNLDLKILDKWVVVNNDLPFDLGQMVGGFTINNTSYVISGTNYKNGEKMLWRLNTSDFSWQHISIPFDFQTGLVTSVGGKAYLFANKDNTSSFWEYNPATDSWTQKANFTNMARLSGTIFSIGDKVYLGLGSDQNYAPDYTFYQYSITQNTWKRIADYPTRFGDDRRVNASSFVINGLAYVGGGAINTGMYTYYSYRPESNVWVQIADFPDARGNAIPFVVNGYGYIAGGTLVGGSPWRDCHKYDATLNRWILLPDPVGIWPLGGTGIDYGFVLVNGGNVYIGARGMGTGTDQLFQARANEL